MTTTRSAAPAPRSKAPPAPPAFPAQAPGAAPIAGIVIDVPDVLYDATLWKRWLFRMINHLGVPIAYADFACDWDAALVPVCQGRRDRTEVLQTFLLGFGLSWAQVDEIEAAGRIQQQNLETEVRPLPGVVRTLEAVKRRGLPLVAWADVPLRAAALVERLEKLTLARFFQAALTSCELGSVQPAAGCYQAGIEALGLPCEQVLYLGHDAAHLAGAGRFGLRTAAVNFVDEPAAQHPLGSIEQLLEIL